MNPRSSIFVALCLSTALGLLGCGGGSNAWSSMTQPVLDNYAANLYAAYSDAVIDEMSFADTVQTFVAAPTETNLANARIAWLASRGHYMLTEGGRFYGGPIDAEPPANGGYEAQINSWPLDEAYVDYSTDPTTGAIDDTMGLVNQPSALPTITVDAIDTLNAQGGDDNISDGYHAIEFLLWGQALQAVGPGMRPATDYQVGGPRPNVDRRAAYLMTATQGVIQHLTSVRDAWAPGASYRATFLAGGAKSVGLAFTGLGRMSKGELANQRIDAPYESKSRRDQHDCFSSDTLYDYIRDAQGLQNMYLGVYGSTSGPGLDALVKIADAPTNTQLTAQLATSVSDMQAIPMPFEASIAGADTDPGRMAILATINSLRMQGDLFATAAKSLGQSIMVPDNN